ncbi:MAG: SH3 domain-containing protein [Thermoanaerobaculia bacterium]
MVVLVLTLSCGAPESTQKVDTRDAIAIYYVTAPELKVHAKPSDQAEVVTKFLNGESAAVLSRRNDDWVEVRTANGSGWAHMSELGSADQAKQTVENPTPRFEKVPAPIASPGTHGTIYIEANVNTDGQVTSAKIITNTTGSDDLARRNIEALEQSRFYPIVIKGEKKPFVYYYRVDY